MSLKLPALPPALKPVAHLLKLATEHETRDPVVTYWARLAALQNGMKLDRASDEALAVHLPLMDWLEKEKKVLKDEEAVSSEVVAAAHLENYALKLFAWADREDRAGHANKNVVKSFYTTGILLDVLVVLGDLTPENAHARKYAKWKAAYIHNCLKNGEVPVPGPAASGEEEEGAEAGASASAGGWSQPQIPPQAAQPPINPVPAPRPSVQPAQPAPAAADDSSAGGASASSSSGRPKMSSAEVAQIQKYCKYASSALDYDDANTAVDNLQKALAMLQAGQDS